MKEKKRRHGDLAEQKEKQRFFFEKIAVVIFIQGYQSIYK